jgi:hypothetical protein
MVNSNSKMTNDHKRTRSSSCLYALKLSAKKQKQIHTLIQEANTNTAHHVIHNNKANSSNATNRQITRNTNKTKSGAAIANHEIKNPITKTNHSKSIIDQSASESKSNTKNQLKTEIQASDANATIIANSKAASDVSSKLDFFQLPVTPVDWSALDSNMLAPCFGYLTSLVDLCHLMSVCKVWYKLIGTDVRCWTHCNHKVRVEQSSRSNRDRIIKWCQNTIPKFTIDRQITISSTIPKGAQLSAFELIGATLILYDASCFDFDRSLSKKWTIDTSTMINDEEHLIQWNKHNITSRQAQIEFHQDASHSIMGSYDLYPLFPQLSDEQAASLFCQLPIACPDELISHKQSFIYGKSTDEEIESIRDRDFDDHPITWKSITILTHSLSSQEICKQIQQLLCKVSPDSIEICVQYKIDNQSGQSELHHFIFIIRAVRHNTLHLIRQLADFASRFDDLLHSTNLQSLPDSWTLGE